MRLYLDTCCLCRPFDDLAQERVRLESEAVLAIIAAVARGDHDLLESEILAYELGRVPDEEQRRAVLSLLRGAKPTWLEISDREVDRARNLQALGFGAEDALHLAAAEVSADAFVTVDDRLLRRARRFTEHLTVTVTTPDRLP